MARGVQVTSVADPRDLGPALADTRPTVLFGVPNVWQKMQTSLESAVDAEPRRVRRATARWALDVGRRTARAELNGSGRGPWVRSRHRLATTIVLAPLRRRLGLDRVRFAASGAAPIPAEVLEYFHGLGIRVTEVWGLSEAAGVSTTTTVSEPALGTVGKPLPAVEIKLARDGEVLVRGPMVMSGYRNDPEATGRVLDSGGWLATGDLGEIDERGNLRIIGRRSDMIINSAGKNIAPANIESTVRAASFLIGHVMVIGDRLPYVTALITLDAEAIAADAEAAGFTAADIDVLATRPSIRHRVTEAVRTGNAAVSRPEQIKRFVILDHPWSVETGELTPKSTLRRAAITTNYADLIESLYSDRPDTSVIDLH